MEIIFYSIVVPVYKTATSLIELADRIDKVFSKLEYSDYELIFVNDSPFYIDSVKTLDQISINNPKVIVIELMKNFGQQPATLCGIENSNGDYVITMDDDLQHAPEDILQLIKFQEHDVVIASFSNKKHNYFKRVTSDLKGYFDHIVLGKPKNINLSPYRLINSTVAKLMFKRKTPYPFIPALLFGITNDVVNVEVEHHKRFEGKSNYNLIKLIQVFSNLIINNSSILLRFIGFLGISISFFSIVFGVIILIKKLVLAYVVPGWSSTMIALLFFGGMTLFSLGIIGEYLIRIISTTEHRPIYFIRKIKKIERI